MLQLVELFNNLYDYVFDTVAKGSASSTFWDDIPFELANLLFGLIVTYVIRDTFFNNVNPPNGHHPNQQQVVAAEQPAPPVHDIPAPVGQFLLFTLCYCFSFK
uniref:Uncharacterized protein n=1 Tax=Panagrolaimus davidi TaxID=227884 RepID=A0A914QJT3_9BILA